MTIKLDSLVKLATVKQKNIIGRLINGQQLFIKVNKINLIMLYSINYFLIG